MKDPEEDADERPGSEPQEPERPASRPPTPAFAASADEDSSRVGFAPSAVMRVLHAIRVPGALVIVGILLTVVGPLPGLGVFLIIGAGLLTFVMGMTALVGA